MESYSKKGKKQGGHFPINQREIWNDKEPRDNITSDVLGSYSGTDASDGEPVQDADDL